MGRTIPVGIDLGTTNCVLAYLDAEGQTQLIRDSFDKATIPSVVALTSDKLLFGREALAQLNIAPENVARDFKRDMGSPQASCRLAGRALPPEVLQAYLLKHLRAEIERAMGTDYQAVITVPAYFDEVRRQKTLRAAEMAGVPTVSILNEPTAAALAFGQKMGLLHATGAPRKPMNVLVYDLGGGTFDVTVVRLSPDECVTLATDGDMCLGGNDWDLRLQEYAIEQLSAEHPELAQWDESKDHRLRDAVVKAKHSLSSVERTTLNWRNRQQMYSVPISRDTFEKITRDLMERTMFTTRSVLRDAGVGWNDISHLLLVGGATRMPVVSRKLLSLSGLEPDRSISPDEAVGRGAAIYALNELAKKGIVDESPQLNVQNVSSHSLGIEGFNTRSKRRENVCVIPRNTPLPAAVTRNFVTKRDGQDKVVVRVLEGESKSPAECSMIGKAVIRDLPRDFPAGSPVKVSYQYDADATLSVEAWVTGIGNKLRLVLSRNDTVTQKELANWKTMVRSDGGLDEFEEMLSEVLGDETLATEAIDEGDPVETDTDFRLADEQAMPAKKNTPDSRPSHDPSGKSRPNLAQQKPPAENPNFQPMAITESRDSFTTVRRKSGSMFRTLVFFLGFLVSAVLGLWIGAMILHWIAPDHPIFDKFDLPTWF